MATAMSSLEDPWSISVKTVGIGFTPDEEAATVSASISNANGERRFVVEVSPDDEVASLHEKIEGATGLKASQQRLIYRGRLIGGKCEQSDDAKIKDIAGLCDGQTIHLVKKRDTDNATETERNQEESPQTSSSRSSNLESDILGTPGSGGGGGSLLAALLGLSSLPDENNNEERGTTTSAATRGPRWGWRSSRLGRSRRPHYRLTVEDLEVPDPGSMEPVRQGLMTLHTLLPHARSIQSEEISSPLEANREWYRGQWIDCRDTVNQWLEATIVEIMDPEDILPDREPTEAPPLPRHRRVAHVANDPAVSASDLEGRKRLLLEPCESDDPEQEEGSVAGFRRRDNNVGVQLLLIHYNGWPHRWDEWIRSDSERIRSFRTRTRHPNVSSTASPTPQSIFNDAPRTNITYGDEAEERSALLPELFRAVSVVNELLSEVVSGASPNSLSTSLEEGNDDLPWIRETPTNATSPSDSASYDDVDSETRNNILDDKPPAQEPEPSPRRPAFSRRQLQNLAPLLDRLGRTLTDAAPHVASLADNLPPELSAPEGNREDDSASSTPRDMPEIAEGGEHPPLGGLLSLWNRERRRQSQSASNDDSQSASNVDTDHVDYASGVVNTSRGEVRAGPRSRPQSDDVSSLLGAYLAAASLGGVAGSDDNEEGGLGRLLRERGGGGGGGSGGIDIHIHAVVTAPGGGGGDGLGVTTLGGPIPAATVVGGGGSGGGGGSTRTLFSPSTRDRSSSLRTPSILRSRHSHSHQHSNTGEDDVEDAGLFSELYSENPDPVDPNGSPDPDERRATMLPPRMNEDPTDFMFRISSAHEEEPLENSAGISSTRRNRRTSSSRRQSEGRRGWGRLFRRRRSARDNHDSV